MYAIARQPVGDISTTPLIALLIHKHLQFPLILGLISNSSLQIDHAKIGCTHLLILILFLASNILSFSAVKCVPFECSLKEVMESGSAVSDVQSHH